MNWKKNRNKFVPVFYLKDKKIFPYEKDKAKCRVRKGINMNESNMSGVFKNIAEANFFSEVLPKLKLIFCLMGILMIFMGMLRVVIAFRNEDGEANFSGVKSIIAGLLFFAVVTIVPNIMFPASDTETDETVYETTVVEETKEEQHLPAETYEEPADVTGIITFVLVCMCVAMTSALILLKKAVNNAALTEVKTKEETDEQDTLVNK